MSQRKASVVFGHWGDPLLDALLNRVLDAREALGPELTDLSEAAREAALDELSRRTHELVLAIRRHRGPEIELRAADLCGLIFAIALGDV